MTFNINEISHMEKVIDTPVTAAHQDMIDSYNAQEEVFEGFLGGVQVESNKVEQESFTKKVLTNPVSAEEMTEDYEPVYEDVEVFGDYYYSLVTGTSTDEEGNEVEVITRLPATLSLSGYKALVRVCTPLSLKSWTGASNDLFYKCADYFGVDNLMTKSEFTDKLNGVYYLAPSSEDI